MVICQEGRRRSKQVESIIGSPTTGLGGSGKTHLPIHVKKPGQLLHKNLNGIHLSPRKGHMEALYRLEVSDLVPYRSLDFRFLVVEFSTFLYRSRSSWGDRWLIDKWENRWEKNGKYIFVYKEGGSPLCWSWSQLESGHNGEISSWIEFPKVGHTFLSRGSHHYHHLAALLEGLGLLLEVEINWKFAWCELLTFKFVVKKWPVPHFLWQFFFCKFHCKCSSVKYGPIIWSWLSFICRRYCRCTESVWSASIP